MTGNYLRVRGEYPYSAISAASTAELPPRTRRIPLTSPPKMNSQGTTSAYAENTKLHRHWGFLKQNYLRVRGEYPRTGKVRITLWELPPRTRRIQALDGIERSLRGTTSAYAENTKNVWHGENCSQNYLRVRGEYPHPSTHATAHAELPPRTRRIPDQAFDGGGRLGTTSAYAENTACSRSLAANIRNYLRVRGEYDPPMASIV